MAFEITQHGSTIVITKSEKGIYDAFEDARAEIIRREESIIPAMQASPHAIKEIAISVDRINFPIQDGLKKLKAGLGFDGLLSQEQKNKYKEQIAQEKHNAEQRKKEESAALEQREKEVSAALEHREKEVSAALESAKSSGRWSDYPEEIREHAIADIILTTSMFVAGREIEHELDVITYECAYGMNIFRDLFASVRDFVGGRSKAVEKVLRDARTVSMRGLREEALNAGADAVIAIDLDYSELSGGGKSGMLVVIASGTAVKLKPTNN